MQFFFPDLLYPDFPDGTCAPVISLIHTGYVFRIQAANITENMGQKFTIGIMSGQVGNNISTLKSMPVDCKPRNLALIEIEFHRNTIKYTIMTPCFVETLAVILAEYDYFGQLIQQHLDTRRFPCYLFGNDLQSVGGTVFCNDPSTPVINHPPVGCYRPDTDAVAFRTRGKVIVGINL